MLAQSNVGYSEDFKSLFVTETAEMDYFLVTLLGELESQPMLKARLYENMEMLVEERTRELSDANQRLKEEIRLQTEHSLESGPEEFAWIMEPIRENVENTIRIMFKGICSNIRIAELPDNSFVPLEGVRLEKLEEQKKLK